MMDAKILIVDDSPEIIDILSNMLPKNIQGQVALDGPSAIELLRESSDLPDLILLDVMMPEISGYKVCKMIKEDSRLREIPIIFISSLDQDFDKVLAFKMGAVDYITKPLNRGEVLARIKTHLENYKSKQIISNLYSETILGTIGAMNDMLAIANPEVSNLSNSMKMYSEKIMEKLEIREIWDLRLACVFSGLGMLSVNMEKASSLYQEEDPDKYIQDEISRKYDSLDLSNDIIGRIPRFEAVTKIIEKAKDPLEKKYHSFYPEEMEPEVLKGQILRILIYYLTKFEENKNYIDILGGMKKSEEEYYNEEILDALSKVQTEITNNEIINIDISRLKTGMILVEDLYCPDGRLVLKAGYELSEDMILLIKNFERLEASKIEVICY